MKQLLNKSKNAFIISQHQRKLIFLVFWLSIYRNLLLAVKSKKAFTEHILQNKKLNSDLTVEKITIAKDIAMAIYIVNKCVLWKNVCRHQSWQAVYLLLQYQIPFDYTVGIEKNKPRKEGHSWVKVNNKFICGKCNENEFTIVFRIY